MYCWGKYIRDYTLIDMANWGWYPLKVAKELFKEQHLCRACFADLLKQLWKERNQITSTFCKGEHPSDLLDAKIDVLVKFCPQRPDQFTFEDVELLHRLQAALKKGGIADYFWNIHDEKEPKAARYAARR